MNGDHPVNECSNDPERNLRQEALMVANNQVSELEPWCGYDNSRRTLPCNDWTYCGRVGVEWILRTSPWKSHTIRLWKHNREKGTIYYQYSQE
jgi:hypothetical protein